VNTRDQERRSGRVRSYALTGGRTSAEYFLRMETLVTALDRPRDQEVPEVRLILELVQGVRSIAEISALLHVPLGVVRVLVGDLAEQGRISVYQDDDGAERPDRATLEKVLGGLRRL
jgi:hypothetical protein